MANEVAASPAAAVAGRLRVAMMRLVRRMKRETEGAETAAAISALAAIQRLGAPTAGEFAAAEGISRPSASAQADALEARGLIVRRPSERDRRVVHLEITPGGERALSRSRSERTAWLARRIARLDAREVKTLEDAAAILEGLLEP